MILQYSLSTRINDGHVFPIMLPTYNRLYFIYITLVDTSTIIKSSLEGSLLQRGDIILKINEKGIMSLRDSLSVLIPTSNKGLLNKVINCCIYNYIHDGCILSILRNNKKMNINEVSKRGHIVNSSSSPYYTISSDIGYVNLGKLKSSEINNMINSLMNCSGLIFDWKNYPLNIVPWDIYRFLSSNKEFCYALATQVDLSHIGAFYKHECITQCPDELWQESDKYKGKVVVLINESAISYAETLAMSLRILGATLIGTPTTGANGDIAHISLPCGITMGGIGE